MNFFQTFSCTAVSSVQPRCAVPENCRGLMGSERDSTLRPEKFSSNASFPAEQQLDFSGITPIHTSVHRRSWKETKPVLDLACCWHFNFPVPRVTSVLILFPLKSQNTGLWKYGLDLGPISATWSHLTSPSVSKKSIKANSQTLRGKQMKFEECVRFKIRDVDCNNERFTSPACFVNKLREETSILLTWFLPW